MPNYNKILGGHQWIAMRLFQRSEEDHLSPYLFLLVVDVFSQMLNKKYTAHRIGYHPNTSSIHVTHLAFADDIIMFFSGEK